MESWNVRILNALAVGGFIDERIPFFSLSKAQPGPSSLRTRECHALLLVSKEVPYSRGE